MSESDRLSLEVLANLRAIRAGEPWPCPEISVPRFAVIPPSDFVQGSTWRLTPDGVAVLALADERDALRKAVNVQAHLAMLPESSVQAMKDLGRNVQPESIYMVPDWAVEPEPDALGERPPMHLTRAGKAWLAERVARMSNAADARVNALDNRVREVFTEPITAEEGIERLVRERDALRKRVAENDAYEAAWAAGAQAACARQLVQDCPYTDEALCKAWVSGYAYDGWIPGGVLAVERESEFQGKIEALRKRVADFERLLTEPKVEQARLLALRDLSEKLYTDGSGYTTVEARQDEILSAFPDVVDEALAANLHRRLNKGVAGALGLLEMQKDPKTGESYLPSWHDLPERVVALVQEGEALREQVKALTDERAALLAPLGDVDLEEVLRLESTPARTPSTAEARDGALAYAAPALAREVIRLRVALRLADEQSAEAIQRVSSEILADKWNSTAELQAEVERLRTQFQETRLTLLAEQGKPEGAPPGWSYKPGDPDFDEPGEWVNKKLRLKVWKSGTGWVWGRKERSGVFVGPSEQEDGQPARVVMLAATAAVKSGGAR